MNIKLHNLCLVDTRVFLWLIGLVFAVTLMVQHLACPQSDVLSSSFSAGKKLPQTSISGLGIRDSNSKLNMVGNLVYADDVGSPNVDVGYIIDEPELLDGRSRGGHHHIPHMELANDTYSDPEAETPSEDFVDLNAATVEVKGNNSFQEDEDRELDNRIIAPIVFGSSLGPSWGRPITLTPAETRSIDITPAISSVALAPFVSNSHVTPVGNINEPSSAAPLVLFNSNSSSMGKDFIKKSIDGRDSDSLHSNVLPSSDVTSTRNTSPMRNSDEPTDAVVSISEMSIMLQGSRKTIDLVKPQWPSLVDQELLHVKSMIEYASSVPQNARLYAPLYRNVSMFERSYELMEQILKIYIYKEGEKPVFHTPVLKGIYASEGWFMKQLKASKHFVTRNPNLAHLFYLPFSSKMLEETLYIANSHSHTNLIQYLSNYLDFIVSRYNYWNRTGGADHFLVACHDWAPTETRRIMANCIRALCNADIKEGFQFGKDVSLPETYILSAQNPLRELGGKPPSQRPILAFFAGSMHGYVRPILLKYWENKDPDMKIFGLLSRRKSKHKGRAKGQMDYVQYMKSSKYCICAKGYEVNSPRVVEAIFYECVPVIISDNFVPPFFETLNWESFAVFVLEKDIPNLKSILVSIPEKKYLEMQKRVKQVQQHFLWHPKPEKYDIFHMILHSIWFNRVFTATGR